MTITRYVNDQLEQFELTYPEMLQAYCEIQKKFDIENIEHLCSKNKLYLKPDEKDKAAEYYRTFLDNDTYINWSAVFCVCEKILNERNLL